VNNEVLIAGRYRLERKVGEGGFSEVWAAIDSVLNVRVAVKLPLSPTREQQVLLLGEARTAASVGHHPNILPIVDAPVWVRSSMPDTRVLVSEFIDGCAADEFAVTHLARRADALTKTALGLYVTMCAARGLQYAHEKGVLHRDIKPGNILVSRRGDVKLADFGIAKIAQQSTRKITAKQMHTPLYSPPERFEGKTPGRAGDYYALGCSLYELLEGAAPHAGAVDLLVRKLYGRTPSPSKLGGLTQAEHVSVMTLYKGLMAHEPSRRLAAHDCIETLANILQRSRWQLHFQKSKTVPPELAKEMGRILNYEPFIAAGHAGESLQLALVPPLEYADAQEAMEETIAMVLAGGSKYVYLQRVSG